jgi:hypothetical protein
MKPEKREEGGRSKRTKLALLFIIPFIFERILIIEYNQPFFGSPSTITLS